MPDNTDGAKDSQDTEDHVPTPVPCTVSFQVHRVTGCREASEHERIVTCVLPFVEGHRLINNVNGLLLDFLYLKAVGDWELMKKL